jgi:predicted ester cyclase
MSTTDQNKALAYRYFDEQWNHKNDAVIEELLGPGMDPEAARAHFEATHATFGDVRFTIEDLVAEGDQVVVQWTSNSEHRGEIAGFTPTGERITFDGLANLRIVEGKIVSDKGFSNLLETLMSRG